jgi:hypothetical protein
MLRFTLLSTVVIIEVHASAIEDALRYLTLLLFNLFINSNSYH